MRNVTKLLLLACTALITVFTSCQAIAANSGQSLSSDTVWIRLIPGAPFEDGNGLRTAELTLDFSKAIAGLETGIDEAELAEIFTFELVDAEGTVKSAEMKATAVRKYAEAFYLLTVGNIPADGGIAKLTVKRSGIAPPFRLWALDGGEADEFVSLDPNRGIYDGGAPAECKIFALGEGFTLPDPSGSGFDWSDALPLITKPSHTARAFIDWNTEADGGGTSYSAGAAITEALTLYAQWTPVWTVSFALNGGAGDIPAAETVVAGALAEFSLPDDSGITAPNEHWLAFLGWDSRADGNGTNYNAGANYTPDANIILYARWDGDGSAEQYAIEIHNRAELEAVASGLDKHYKVVEDIDLHDWTPLGGGSTNAFTGVLDGNGKTITFDGTITAYEEGDTKYAGLFAGINGGTVKNMNIAGTITVSIQGSLAVGAVVSYMQDGSISNVKSTVLVHATATGLSVAGGIVGSQVGGAISNCWTTGAMTATTHGTDGLFCFTASGGIVGFQGGTGASITSCYAVGDITVTYGTVGAMAGGILGGRTEVGGYILNSVALNSSISASILTDSANTGRVAGQLNYGANNWAISIDITQNDTPTTVSDGALDDKNGAAFGDPATLSSWTSAGPGWTIAANQADADEDNPWWWDGDHPALFWE